MPSDFQDLNRLDPLEKIDELCDHLVEQIRGQKESSRLDSKVCQLQADLQYLERQLVQSKIRLAQSKAEYDNMVFERCKLETVCKSREDSIRDITEGTSNPKSSKQKENQAAS